MPGSRPQTRTPMPGWRRFRLQAAPWSRTETGDGTTLAGRHELGTILDFIHPGETLVVTRIDRLARSMRDLQVIVATLKGSTDCLRCSQSNPSRRSSRATSPGCVQRSASSRIRSRYSAVNWRRFGLAATSGSGGGLAPISFNVIDSLAVIIGSHLHRPAVFPRGTDASSMLAERARGTFGTLPTPRCDPVSNACAGWPVTSLWSFARPTN